MDSINYAKYYDLESYLFNEVSPRFHRENMLGAQDFFCIIIWKANRAKSKIAKRLLKHGPYSDLDTAVRTLTHEIWSADNPKARLSVLINEWGFYLPMASAILTVLFPQDFSVYDVRVCEVLGDFQDAQYKKFERLWERYLQYLERVRGEVPHIENLRDKDRYLWAKSFYLGLARDVQNQFKKTSPNTEDAQ
ncbi:MAG: hypothetical protein ABI947_07395 [Chloroflexota bacterium]